MALALALYLAAGDIRSGLRRRRRPALRSGRRQLSRRGHRTVDPGAERRAERRARTLLRSVVNREEWEMYRDLGFIRVTGHGPNGARHDGDRPDSEDSMGSGEPAPDYGYLIYPHKPIVAYLIRSNSLLSEYCVEFPDVSDPLHGPKLPASDDVLAKWMMIRADEERLLRDANMHLPGRQVDPQRARRDLWRLAEWDRARGSAA
jgi:hypothetical protein